MSELQYLQEAIDGFINDPPDSDFQRGYLGALLVLYREAFHQSADARFHAADALQLDAAGLRPTLRIVVNNTDVPAT